MIEEEVLSLENVIEPQPCVWIRGSTCSETGKSELPQPCQEKGCNGYNIFCESYQPINKYQKQQEVQE